MRMIETHNLQFNFSKNGFSLNDVNIHVEEGAVYGFLGPNGSGKTTTIRLLLGLLPNQSDNIQLFGKSLQDNRIEILSNTGTLIEQPSLYEHLSGFDNLNVTRINRHAKRKQIDEVLQLVDLKSVSNKKVRTYSLGMKQRLGLAIALLSEPKLLILDEPINGLDPSGIIEIRELLLKLNKERGITIFLSSHLLSEIEKIVTHLGVLSKGKLVFQGSYRELKEAQRVQSTICIETNDTTKALSILKDTFSIKRREANNIELDFQGKEQFAMLCKSLVEANIDIYDMKVLSKDLENTFLEITKN